jgi:hypothetical protein
MKRILGADTRAYRVLWRIGLVTHYILFVSVWLMGPRTDPPPCWRRGSPSLDTSSRRRLDALGGRKVQRPDAVTEGVQDERPGD